MPSSWNKSPSLQCWRRGMCYSHCLQFMQHIFRCLPLIMVYTPYLILGFYTRGPTCRPSIIPSSNQIADLHGCHHGNGSVSTPWMPAHAGVAPSDHESSMLAPRLPISRHTTFWQHLKRQGKPRLKLGWFGVGGVPISPGPDTYSRFLV